VNDIQLLIPDFSLILCGYLVCRHSALNRTVWEQVDRLVYFFLFPILLFQSISRTPLNIAAASQLITSGIVLSLSGVALAFIVPYLPGMRSHAPRREHAACAQVAFRFNSFIALALAERLGGQAGVQLIAVLIGFCVPLCNMAALWPMARHGDRAYLSELLRNPLFLSTAAGLGANLLGLHAPDWMNPTLNRIGAAIALGLMAAGAGMQLSALSHAPWLSASMLGIRHLILPCVAWLLAAGFQLEPLQRTILLAFSALPTASSGYVLAARMGYNGAFVAGLITLSTLAGMFSLWLALGVLR
jgi:malonate transporter and related proteins